MENLKNMIFILIISQSLGLTLYLEYGQSYCFVEDRPAQEDIHLNFEIHRPKSRDPSEFIPARPISLRRENKEEGLFAQIRPSTGLIKEFMIIDYKGVLFYPVESSGRNEICIVNKLQEFQKALDPLSISLKFSSALSETIAAPIAEGNETQEEYIQHTRQFSSIIKRKTRELQHYQEYEIKKEGEFKNSIEHTNSMIQWCAIFETIILLIVGIYQIFSLRSFFIQRGIS